MPSVTTGGQGQFTYDFGIAIAQSTVNKVARLAGVSLTLASAYNALRNYSIDYVKTLKTTALQFGGYVKTLQAIEMAQKNIIKGVSFFKVEDQLKGMRQLMAAGVNVRKNYQMISKSAHAMGVSFTDFSSAISEGIQGNMNSLVEMGLLTHRATRMFEKYQSNTIMRQQAILNFVKQHKGLQTMIANDFQTTQDQMLRLGETWRMFMKNIVGDPRDPGSLYGQVVTSLRAVADGIANNMTTIKRGAFVTGKILGWFVKQVGEFIMWVGRGVKNTLKDVDMLTDNYRKKTYDTILWLEFWKIKIVKFFKQFKGEIKALIILLLVMKGISLFSGISRGVGSAIISLGNFRGLLKKVIKEIKAFGVSGWLYRAFSFKLFKKSRTRQILKGLGIEPTVLKKALGEIRYSLELFFSKFGKGFLFALKNPFKSLWMLFGGFFKFLGRGSKFIFSILRNLPAILGTVLKLGRAIIAIFLGSNPIGWIILAISLFVVLYTKVKFFRDAVNAWFQAFVAYIRLIYNSVIWLYVQIRVGLKRIGSWMSTHIIKPITGWFSSVGTWISEMWNKFKDTSVGKFLDKYLVSPIKWVFDKVKSIWSFVTKIFNKATAIFNKGSNALNSSTQALAKQYGISAPVWTVPTTPVNNPQVPPTKPSNTPISNPLIPKPAPVVQGEEAYSNVMHLESGAVQIIIEKGQNMDEQKIAKLVRQVLLDIQRTDNTRGGNI